MSFPIIRWFLSIPAAMFYSMAAATLHETLSSPSGVPGLMALLAQLFLNASIALWFFADARRRERPLFHDAGGLPPENETVVKCSFGSKTRRTKRHEDEQTQRREDYRHPA